MNKQLIELTLPINGMKFKALCVNKNQMSAKFQIWCAAYGINDEQSLALWFAKTDRDEDYFEKGEAEKIANKVLYRLPKTNEPIDLTYIQ